MSREPSVREGALEVSNEDDFLYYLRRGAELLHRGHASEARAALERACELRTDSPKARNLLGLTYFKLGLLEPARAIYENLVHQHPHEPALHVNLGLVLLRQGRLEDAESAMRTALMLAPDHTRAHCYLGLTLYRRGALHEAREHFLRGEQPEFARRIDEKIAAMSGPPSHSWQALRAVAEEGLGQLDRVQPFTGVAADELPKPDETGWQTQVGHQPQQRVDELDGGLVIAPGTGPIPSPYANTASVPPNEMPPPSVVAARLEPVTHEEIELPFPMQPVAVDLGLRRPSISAQRKDSARFTDLPPIPFVEPSLRLFADLSWAPGFSTGRELGPQARLVIGGPAYVRRSALIAGVGSVSFEDVVRADERGNRLPLGGSADPIVRLNGEARFLLKVWHLASALRDARSMVVVESALVGFEGEFEWSSRQIRALDVVRLEGRGSLLLDCPGAPIVTTLRRDQTMMINPESVLAWTDDVLVEPAPEESAGGHLLYLRGHGLVIIAAPERDLAPQGLVSRL